MFLPLVSLPECLILSAIVTGLLANAQDASFQSYSPAFSSILGTDPAVTLVCESDLALFHEAGVYYPPAQSLFVTSDEINTPSIKNNKTARVISVITGLTGSSSACHIETLTNSTIIYPISAYRFKNSTSDVIAYVGHNDKANTSDNHDGSGGVFFLNPHPPYNATNVLSKYLPGDYPFNSFDDITVGPDGSIWLTDPIYGYLEGYSPAPALPNQVYRFDPAAGTVRAIADGFGRPNGIATNAAGSVVYIGDSGANVGNGTIDNQGPRTVYAYDVQSIGGGVFLGNRRVFAFIDTGGPDGLKVDTMGNVYVGIGGAVAVYNSGGELLGKILFGDDQIGNIGFGEKGTLFVMGGTQLFRVDLSPDVLGVNMLT